MSRELILIYQIRAYVKLAELSQFVESRNYYKMRAKVTLELLKQEISFGKAA